MTKFVVEFGNVGKPPEADGRLDAPAFHRNHDPIWAVLAPYLRGQAGDALEVGSGTGQHIVEFARKTPALVWWPSDASEKHLASIAAWRRHANLPNLRPPQRIDLSDPDWRLDGYELCASGGLVAIICINVLHIAPWRVSVGLFGGAGRYLRAGGRLFVYGPFMRDGAHTAPSNAAFDQSLRAQNGEWGVRDIADLSSLAEKNNLKIADIAAMPANNLVLIFQRNA
jgi:SAM-dependent methyltransferase